MSDGLLKRSDEISQRIGTHWDGCWQQHDGCLAVLLAVRVRELEAELNKQEAWHARAVASMDDASRAVGVLCCDLIPERVDALRAENERLRGLLRHAQHDLWHYIRSPELIDAIDAALAKK